MEVGSYIDKYAYYKSGPSLIWCDVQTMERNEPLNS